jgi:hypothetical protein
MAVNETILIDFTDILNNNPSDAYVAVYVNSSNNVGNGRNLSKRYIKKSLLAILLLQTNGVNNPLQSVLNLIAGSNITLTPNGVGGVTIDSSGGGSSILLQTDGVDNPTQNILNLVEGTNMTITDDGAGNITFDATGGGGGSGTVTSVATAGLISGGTITTSGTITTLMNTNKLVGRYSASTGIMEEIAIGSGLTLTGAGVLNNTATPTPLGYYGAFSDVTDQFATVINTGYPMLLGVTDLTNGVTVVSGSRVTIANTGIYNIQWSAQFRNPDAAEHDVTIWLRKNGVDVPGSAGIVSVPRKHGSLDGHVLPSWNFLLDPIAGDYYEFVWSTTDIDVFISFEPAGSPPPSTASVVLTVTQQAGILAGTGITGLGKAGFIQTGATQTLVEGTSGTDFNIVSSSNTQTFNIPSASALNRGLLLAADWTIFNNKFNTPIGTTAQYVRGDGSLATFPSIPSAFITYRRLAVSSTLDATDLANVNLNAPYVVEMDVATANNLTIPLNATVAFPTGSQITVSQYGAGQTTIVATVGVTLRSTGNFLKLAAQYSMCTLMKVGTNEWYVVGQLAP